MPGSGAPREVSLTLPMAPDMEITASKAATHMAEAIGMSAEKVDEVRLAVVEACINAFEHSRSPDRTVYLTFRVVGAAEEPALEIRVRDSGVGFAPDRIEVPRIAEKIRSPRKRGWGLKIIEGLMDEVEIDSGHGGTTVVMRKAR